MSILINKARCAELNLPIPHSFYTCESYVLRCISNAYTLNTRTCRYISISNLHSVVSALKNRDICLTVEHKKVYDPALQIVFPFHVGEGSMTPEQREEFLNNKKPAKA
jgi:hypothetical protein